MASSMQKPPQRKGVTMTALESNEDAARLEMLANMLCKQVREAVDVKKIDLRMLSHFGTQDTRKALIVGAINRLPEGFQCHGYTKRRLFDLLEEICSRAARKLL